jgi:hypothetical protein
MSFVVMDESEKTGLSFECLKSGIRKTKKALVVADIVDRKQLSDDDKRRHDIVNARGSAMLATAQIKRTADLPTL